MLKRRYRFTIVALRAPLLIQYLWRSIAEIYTFDTLCHDFAMFKKARVYLDYAAATPLSAKALAAMKPHLKEIYGNPSAVHAEGVAARQAVESAREQIARTLQVKPEYLTFTSGGTEANNLAIRGAVSALRASGRELSDMQVVTTKIEHPSVLKTAEALQRDGVDVQYAAVNEVGQVDIEKLRALLNKKTVLFSVAFANSEIGTIQKLRAIKKVLEEAERKYGTTIYFHVDAAQALLWLPCQLEWLQADLVSLDVGKCNGPKGVGILMRSRRVKLCSSVYGGGQESGLRPGTENVAGVIGASVALEEAQLYFKKRAEKVAAVRDAGIKHLIETIPSLVLNGPIGEERLVNNINISIPGLDTEFATIVLDKHGFAVSTKSACAGAGGGESIVVKEISGDPARSRSTLRLSLSPEISLKDIERLTTVLQSQVQKMSRFNPV